ncbi:hypothetical protein [Limnospira platensis]|uniref:hypothetical protein n=1 Tax=Limnospira platensis TaxID=118562 RepID=UPI003D6F65EE
METQGKRVRVCCEVDASSSDGVVYRWAPINSDGKVRLFAEVADNALVYRELPYIPGYEKGWAEIPGTRSECSSGYQLIKFLDLPASHPFLRGLIPDNVFFENPDDDIDDISFSDYWGLNT